jgi:hypothetical protein
MGKVTRHIMGALALVAVVATGAACSEGGPSISAGLIARAAASTGHQESTHFVLTMDVAGESIEATGAMNAADGSLVMQLEIPGKGSIEERLVDDVLYMHIPGGATPTEWLKVDLSGFSDELKESARSSSGIDPSSPLESLRAAFGDVETLGRDRLRAGSATHYRVNLDVDRALEDDHGALADLSPVQLKAIRSMDGTPMDVWVDDDGRVLKQQFHMDMPGGLGRATVAIEFYDFETPVAVEAPPADQVTDWTAKFRDTLHI